MRSLRAGNVELMRLKSVLETDRTCVTKNFSSLIRSDIERVINDYFDIKGAINVIISNNENLYTIEITANASRIKAMGSIPD